MAAWQLTPDKPQEIARRLIETSDAEAIVVFGSYARGTAGHDSDLDLLIIVPDEILNCRHHAAQLRKQLADIAVPLDLVVVRKSDFDRCRKTSGYLYRDALREGKVVYGHV